MQRVRISRKKVCSKTIYLWYKPIYAHSTNRIAEFEGGTASAAKETHDCSTFYTCTLPVQYAAHETEAQAHTRGPARSFVIFSLLALRPSFYAPACPALGSYKVYHLFFFCFLTFSFIFIFILLLAQRCQCTFIPIHDLALTHCISRDRNRLECVLRAVHYAHYEYGAQLCDFSHAFQTFMEYSALC